MATGVGLGVAMAGVSLPAVHAAATAGGPMAAPAWAVNGGNIYNTRYQSAETTINTSNVGSLTPKWTVSTGPLTDPNIVRGISATPTVEGPYVYVPDWSGHLYKIDAATGKILWTYKIGTGLNEDTVARTGAAIYKNELIIGDQPADFAKPHLAAHIIAIDKMTGKQLWSTPADSVNTAIISQSPIVYHGRVYVGVSSNTEGLAANPNFKDFSFRGSVLSLDAATGKILWRTYTVPMGFNGGPVWNDTAAIDPKLGLLYVGTGNNYTTPASVTACQTSGGKNCLPASDHIDSILGLDMNSGAIKWSRRVEGSDAWTGACKTLPSGLANCPKVEGPDADFDSGPNLFTTTINGQKRELLGAGQKSGIYWAFDPATGKTVWQTKVGPGGITGGVGHGVSTDGTRIYVPIVNSEHKPYMLTSGVTTSGGAWSALDAATGKILWQTADPMGGQDVGATTVANGVVFGGSLDAMGHMYALNAATGKILWTFASGGSIGGGPSVVNGVVYWGSGYNHQMLGTPNNKFHAFALPGR